MSSKVLKYFANRVLMVEPTKFFFNIETALDNEFMNDIEHEGDASSSNEGEQAQRHEIELTAAKEHQDLVQKIEENGVSVVKYKQQADDLPDSVFPNNWVSIHKYPDTLDEGMVCVYPMKVPTRQREVNYDIVRDLSTEEGHIVDLTHFTSSEKALEGTGVLIFDAANHKIYAGISQR